MSTLIQITPSSGITIGTTAISNGTDGRVLFQGTGGVVQQDSAFVWNNTNKRLDIGNTITPGSIAINLLSNNYIRLGNSHGYIRAAATTSIFFYDAAFNIQAGVSWGGSGSFFNTSLAVGANTAGARLDVRAQGALSTDIASRVRNITDSDDLFFIKGNSDGRLGFLGINASSNQPVLHLAGQSTTSGNAPNILFSSSSINIRKGGTNQWQFVGGASGTMIVKNGTGGLGASDAFEMYSSDIVAGNAAPHFRTEAGDVIKLYKETTAVTAATFAANTSGIVDDTATFDGYTIGQVVKALRNLGILA